MKNSKSAARFAGRSCVLAATFFCLLLNSGCIKMRGISGSRSVSGAGSLNTRYVQTDFVSDGVEQYHVRERQFVHKPGNDKLQTDFTFRASVDYTKANSFTQKDSVSINMNTTLYLDAVNTGLPQITLTDGGQTIPVRNLKVFYREPHKKGYALRIGGQIVTLTPFRAVLAARQGITVTTTTGTKVYLPTRKSAKAFAEIAKAVGE